VILTSWRLQRSIDPRALPDRDIRGIAFRILTIDEPLKVGLDVTQDSKVELITGMAAVGFAAKLALWRHKDMAIPNQIRRMIPYSLSPTGDAGAFT
jgi:hypothetical protein